MHTPHTAALHTMYFAANDDIEGPEGEGSVRVDDDDDDAKDGRSSLSESSWSKSTYYQHEEF
jgi:hypothetical protein